MNGRYLLDTNIAIAFLNNDTQVRLRIKGLASFISAISAGELLFGALNSSDRVQNLRNIRAYLSIQDVLYCDLVTAERNSLIRQQLEQQGERIPENDIWIAAYAMQYGLTLVSRDQHVERVMGLQLENW